MAGEMGEKYNRLGHFWIWKLNWSDCFRTQTSLVSSLTASTLSSFPLWPRDTFSPRCWCWGWWWCWCWGWWWWRWWTVIATLIYHILHFLFLILSDTFRTQSSRWFSQREGCTFCQTYFVKHVLSKYFKLNKKNKHKYNKMIRTVQMLYFCWKHLNLNIWNKIKN